MWACVQLAEQLKTTWRIKIKPTSSFLMCYLKIILSICGLSTHACMTYARVVLDVRSSGFKNRDSREKALEEIAEKLDP